MKFQLEINYGGGTKAFLYSESDDNHEAEGAKVATNWLKTRFTSLKPPRKIIAREYDKDKKDTVRGGRKFALLYGYFKAKGKNTLNWQEWYEPITD